MDIRFALNDSEDVFPQYYKLYGSSAGLKAFSDGVTLHTKGEKPGEWIDSIAPKKEELESQGFKAMGTLSFVLPKVSYAGIYQITTRSFHSIVKLNSSIDYIRRLFGRIDGIPLQLELEPQDAHIKVGGKPAKKTVYTMKLTFDMQQINDFLHKKQQAMAQIQGPNSIPALTEEFSDDEDDSDEVIE